MANILPLIKTRATAATHRRANSLSGLRLGHLKVEQQRLAILQLYSLLGPPCSQRYALKIKALIKMSFPARHIVEPFLRILTRRTNHCHRDQVISEARPAHLNVLLCILPSRPLRPWTRGRRTLLSTLPCPFLHPTVAGPWAMLDPLLPLPWILLPCDDMAIQTTALVQSTSPSHSIPILCFQSYQILTLLKCVCQSQPSIVISLPSSAWMDQQPQSRST